MHVYVDAHTRLSTNCELLRFTFACSFTPFGVFAFVSCVQGKCVVVTQDHVSTGHENGQPFPPEIWVSLSLRRLVHLRKSQPEAGQWTLTTRGSCMPGVSEATKVFNIVFSPLQIGLILAFPWPHKGTWEKQEIWRHRRTSSRQQSRLRISPQRDRCKVLLHRFFRMFELWLKEQCKGLQNRLYRCARTS